MELEHTWPVSPASSCSPFAAGRGAALTAWPLQGLFPSQFCQPPSPSPHFLAHPSDLSVATLPCPPLLSPLSDRCPLFSGIPGFLCLLFREVRAEPLAAPS